MTLTYLFVLLDEVLEEVDAILFRVVEDVVGLLLDPEDEVVSLVVRLLPLALEIKE